MGKTQEQYHTVRLFYCDVEGHGVSRRVLLNEGYAWPLMISSASN